ncbi:uncharacterized protein LTHEOB_814 [Lasiodiplodia theobromae]|uniref:uncharacterized protein n=1 Tax=Lasiodiplodia theobromae TaxID=45133 RepID=UPI0015C32C9D|nr:uncharacterized protein LTHEOB_814 [Lasiodiplodia theobromae]KAF4540872.1 hypothetical protein LTHEOB_814 [Lasiodiplodia theobromae]
MPSNAIMDKAKGVIREKGKRVFMDKFIDRHRAANRSANRQMQMAMQRQVVVNQNDPTTDPDRIIPAARRAEAAANLELFGADHASDNRTTDPNSAKGLRLRSAALVPGSSAAAPPVRARNPTALVSAADLEALLGENKEALDAANIKPQKGGRRQGGAGKNTNKERAGGRGKKEKQEEDSDLPSFASSAYPGAPTDGSIIPRGLMHVNRGFWPKAVRERVERAEAAEAEALRSSQEERRKAGAVERRKERERKREREVEKLRKRELRERKIREERERRAREKKEREEREKAKGKATPSSGGAKKRKADAVENDSDEDEDPVVVPMRKFRRLTKPRKE